MVTSRAFSAYGCPLKMVTSFKYLGQVISEVENDWPEVFRNLVKARAVWWRLKRIIIREGCRDFSLNPWSSQCLFLAKKHGW